MYNPNFYDPMFSPFNNATHPHNDKWFVIMSFDGGETSLDDLREHFHHVALLHHREVDIFRHLAPGDETPMHPTVRNYTKYHTLPFERRVEIGEIIYSTDNVALCILKTCWLRIFQRKARKYLQKILRIRRRLPALLIHRQLSGRRLLTFA